MNKNKKLGFGILIMMCLLILSANILAQKSNQIVVGIPISSFVVLNEIENDNPGGENNACNYVEIRGDSNTDVPLNYYLVEFEGDSGFQGNADWVRNIQGETFGSNGVTTYRGGNTCASRNYVADGGSAFVDTGASLEAGTVTYMIIHSPTTPITQGTDYDPMNSGMLNLPGDATIIDRVGWTDGGAGDIVYGGVDITPGNTTGAPDGATRSQSNTIPNLAAAWFADDIVGDGVDGVLYDQTNFRKSLLGPGFMIAFQTPGAQNLAPTAAPGTISGRARTGKGLGIKHAVIMITGGDLQQPLYATTNQFGYYKFEDLPVGQTYIMQISSGRHTFDNPSRLINLGDSITNEDFITESRVVIESDEKRTNSQKRRILKRQ